MKNLTAKDSVITATIRIGGDIETFFFYESRNYTELINAINHIQMGIKTEEVTA
jgi:hypothetical protein